MGLFRFTKMHFGLVTAPATFCLMLEVFYNVSNVDNVVDDILTFTQTFDQYICVLFGVLERLHSANLTARPIKCSLAYQELECFGHIKDNDKIHPHPDKVTAIHEVNHPPMKKQLRSFFRDLKVLQKIYSKFCIYCFFINTFYQKVLTKQNSVDIISGNCVSKLEISYYKVLDFEAVFSQVFIVQSDTSDQRLGAVP